MDRKRKQPNKNNENEEKKFKGNTESSSPDHVSSGSSNELPAFLISSGSVSDEEYPETPPDSLRVQEEESALDLIEDSNSPNDNTEEQPLDVLEASLINDIESTSSSSSDTFDVTTLIETDSDAETTPVNHKPLHVSLTQRKPRQVVQPKDSVDLPVLLNPIKHPLTILTARPVPVRNGLADELKKVLLDYRSKESFWHFDLKMGRPPASSQPTELVLVKSIKKFRSYCLLVQVQRQQDGQGEGHAESLLLNINWDVGFKALQAGDKLMVNFRGASPLQLNDKQLHLFPFVRRHVEPVEQEVLQDGGGGAGIP